MSSSGIASSHMRVGVAPHRWPPSSRLPRRHRDSGGIPRSQQRMAAGLTPTPTYTAQAGTTNVEHVEEPPPPTRHRRSASVSGSAGTGSPPYTAQALALAGPADRSSCAAFGGDAFPQGRRAVRWTGLVRRCRRSPFRRLPLRGFTCADRPDRALPRPPPRPNTRRAGYIDGMSDFRSRRTRPALQFKRSAGEAIAAASSGGSVGD